MTASDGMFGPAAAAAAAVMAGPAAIVAAEKTKRAKTNTLEIYRPCHNECQPFLTLSIGERFTTAMKLWRAL